MSKSNSTYLLKVLLTAWGLLTLAIVIGRMYEFGLLLIVHGSIKLSTASLLTSVFNDLQASFWGALLVTTISWSATFIFRPAIVAKIKAHLISLIGVLHILLVTYFGATLIPLGAEIWAYSLTEMGNTIIASEQVSILGFSLIVGFYLSIYYICRKVHTLDIPVFLGQKTAAVTVAIIIATFGAPYTFSLPAASNVTGNEKSVNKLSYFLTQSFTSVKWISSEHTFESKYPLMHKASDENVLGPFFQEFDDPPNVVFLLVESLGGEFVGPNGQWTGFAPHLDSLAQQGLYWENGLSLSGRTFGFIPSLLGSLPFGNYGFMDLGPNYPNHQSLISLLGKQGYHTAFYSGYDTYFDGLNLFLNHQQTDVIFNKQKLGNILPETRQSQSYWGVDDKTMFSVVSSVLDTARTFPRLDIIHTLQSHSPFTVPNPEHYRRQFEYRLDSLDLPQQQKNSYRQYSSELTTLLFADQAVGDLMQSNRQRKHYENTIFIITGDHWLIPVPQTTAISRYHVPIIIYSPKLKNAVHFQSINTHANILPSLLDLLDQQAEINMPDSVHWLGSPMDTARQFRNIHSMPLMRNKNRISDYLDGEHYLYGDQLYALQPGLSLIPKHDEKSKKDVKEKLDRYKSINKYVVENDRLYPGKSSPVDQQYTFLTTYDTLFTRLDRAGLSIDEQFMEAQQHAFNGDYNLARAIGKRILLRAPDYYDVQILIGRTYAWQGSHTKARIQFKEVLASDSTYSDAYSAYFDNEFWADNYKDALDIVNRGLKIQPDYEPFLERKAKALSAMDRHKKGSRNIRKIKSRSPEH